MVLANLLWDCSERKTRSADKQLRGSAHVPWNINSVPYHEYFAPGALLFSAEPRARSKGRCANNLILLKTQSGYSINRFEYFHAWMCNGEGNAASLQRSICQTSDRTIVRTSWIIYIPSCKIVRLLTCESGRSGITGLVDEYWNWVTFVSTQTYSLCLNYQCHFGCML